MEDIENTFIKKMRSKADKKKENLRKVKNEVFFQLRKFGNISKKFENKKFNFIESGYIDSLNLMNFLSNLEKKYKVFFDHKFTSSKKFGDIDSLVIKIASMKNKK